LFNESYNNYLAIVQRSCNNRLTIVQQSFKIVQQSFKNLWTIVQ